MFQNDALNQAKCRDTDPDIFFSEDRRDQRRAKALCNVCPVRLRCLDFALRLNIEDGIFGGLKATERRTMLKRLGRHGVQEYCDETKSLLPTA